MFKFFGSKTKPLTVSDYEEQILATVGLIKDQNVWAYDVHFSREESKEDDKKKSFIHTIEVGRGHPETVVLIHGYGATGVFFFKMMAQLAKYVHVFAIDQYGTGNSERPCFKIKDYDETVSFFADAIEGWRKELGLEDFHLLGHSFGGYTAFQYVRTKNPPIKSLYLMSPAGFTGKTDKEMEEGFKKRMKNKASGWRMKMFRAVFYLIEEWQFTPFQLMSVIGRKRAMTKYYKSKRLALSEQQSELFANFYYEVMKMPTSSDKALGVFLNKARYSKKPIIEDLEKMTREKKLPKRLVLMYGDDDWMDKEHSKEQVEKRCIDLDFRLVKDCGHQMSLKQPIEIAKMIVEDLGMEFKEVVRVNHLDHETGEILKAPAEKIGKLLINLNAI